MPVHAPEYSRIDSVAMLVDISQGGFLLSIRTCGSHTFFFVFCLLKIVKEYVLPSAGIAVDSSII